VERMESARNRTTSAQSSKLKRLFYGGPSLGVLHEEYAKRGRIDERAPVKSSGEIRIGAPVELVWELLTDLRGWEGWAPGVHDVRLYSAVAVDARFSWSVGRTRIKSVFAKVEHGRELTWTGAALWTKAVDRYVLEPTEDGATRLYVEESLAGALVPLLFSRAKLEVQHQRWLAALKAVAEGGVAR
jgi:hypothetical protein